MQLGAVLRVQQHMFRFTFPNEWHCFINDSCLYKYKHFSLNKNKLIIQIRMYICCTCFSATNIKNTQLYKRETIPTQFLTYCYGDFPKIIKTLNCLNKSMEIQNLIFFSFFLALLTFLESELVTSKWPIVD